MNINELDSYNLADAVKFHSRLNPRIWGRDEHLLPEVRDKLLAIAADFQEFLGVEDLDIQDITISGSNAAYSYTKNSDIDLHLVVEMPDNPVYQELFTAKKYQYNDEHNIKIGGADVELYVQPADQAHHSQGIYSIKNNEWISIPQRKRAQVDDACVRDKVADLDARIHAAVKSHNADAIATLWNKIKAMRKAGLEQHGEFGCENISFKLLRNSGCIKLLKDAMTAAQDRELSLREAPRQKFRYGYGADVDESSLADMRSAFATDPNLKITKHEVFHGPGEYEKAKKQREAERQEKIARIARTPVKPWPMGVKEGHQGQPYSSEDGVAASTQMFLNEGDEENLVHEFIQHVAMELGIDPMPEIQLHTDPEWSTHNHSFGRYNPDSHTLNVSMPNRHILDVLRTIAHELVHCSQNQQHGGLPNDAGETGSRWENDANARAGIIMRDWANSHPEHFELPALEESASGYIPKNKREAAMPQYAMALSVDIHPGQVGKEANKLALKTGRNGEPGLLQPDAQNLLREFSEFVAEQENLFEITMSPSSLKKLSAQTGALAGMEFEMCVPNIEGNDDGDQEPDYDYDERCRSIEDAVQFFYDGDWNGRRDVERMRERMQSDFSDWLMDKVYQDWERHGEEYLEEWVPNNVDESEWNPEGLEGDERQEALEELIANMHADPGGSDAFDEYREENQESYDESDWLDDEDLDRMSSIENAYSMTWPHWTTVGQGEGSIEEVADSFRDAVGRPILASTSYHSSRVERPSTKNLEYIVEPDSSIDVDDNNDRGLEFVSPPLPIEELLSDLNKVKAWADRTGCYTNDSTGLHINVSVPGWSGDLSQLDYVKLALLLGDEHVLESFGRAGNTYCKSAMGKIQKAVKQNPDKAEELLERMRQGMDQLASKAIHSGVTDKYTSINTKNGYIEFRSPGGDWLNDNFKEIDNTLRRFTVALSAAVDPEKYRKEYLKKLYKLLDVHSEKDPLSYFAKFAAGELPKAALKSFVRQAQLERGVKRGKETGPMWWRVYKEGKNAANGAVIEVVASSREEALDKAAEEWGVFSNEYRRAMYAEPVRPYDGVDTSREYEIYDRRSSAVVATFRASDDDAAIAKLDQFRAAQVRTQGITVPQANEIYGVRSSGVATVPPRDRPSSEPILGSTLDLQRQRLAQAQSGGNWGILITSNGRFVRMSGTGDPTDRALRRFPSREAAEEFLAQTRAENPNMRTDIEIREIPADYQSPGQPAAAIPTIDIDVEPAPAPQPAGGEFTGNWLIRAEDGTVLHRFGGIGNSQADANRTAQAWAQRNPDVMRQHPGGVDVAPEMNESLSESNQLQLKDFVVTISPHALEQCYNRGVDADQVDEILRNINRAKSSIMGQSAGAPFILHNGHGTGLGMRKLHGNKLTLATVYSTSPDFVKGKYPTFRVDADAAKKDLSEDASDYEIHSEKKLDSVLARCCAMIERGQQKDPERYGMVAACVIDPDNRHVYGINLPGADGRRRHAERVAIDKYIKQYGDIPPGSIVVTTLSPCNSPMDERAGESCKDLLNSAGIHKVYCGYVDPTQHDDADADFVVGLTQNDALWESCKAFADTFLHEQEIEEGWRSALAGAAAAGALAFTPAPANSTAAPAVGPAAQPAAVQQVQQAGPEAALTKAAQAAGIKGVELAQFLAQCEHETGDFAHLEELGGNRYLAKYDPTVNPAKAKALGNTQAGDGAKYKGRGFIQITGKANYANAGQALGIDLVNNPELAAKPDVAAKIAVWYWQNRVTPYVQNLVTHAV